MFFEKPQVRGRFAPPPPTNTTDLFDAAINSAWYIDNTNATRTSRVEAFDQKIQSIFAATGVELENPALARSDLSLQFRQGVEAYQDPYEQYANRVEELRAQFPDHAALLSEPLAPLEAAREKAHQADRRLRGAQARYRGFPGTGTAIELAGGVVGVLNDPVNVATLPIGAYGRAALGVKGLLWMGVKQGAANAAVETAFQPTIAAWRKEAGLGYGLSHFAMNVAAAGTLGFGADVAGRGLSRGINRARGNAPVLDEDGGIIRWRSKTESALEEAAARSQNEIVRAASDGDLPALRRLADETGLSDDPEWRSGYEHALDIEAATATRPADVNTHEYDEAMLQGMRSGQDVREPVPATPQRVHQTAEGEIEPPDVVQARRQIEQGDLDLVDLAALIRRQPTAINQSVSLASKLVRDARALSRLSDGAFARINDGVIDPELGVMVGKYVEDPTLHAAALEGVYGAKPRTPDEARHAIAAHSARRNPQEPVDRAGIDEPGGADADAQVTALRERLADDIADVERDGRAPRLDDDISGASFSENLGFATRLHDLSEFLEACRP